MKWNIYILGGSIIFEAILYWFYSYRPCLPLIKNRIFKKLLIGVLVTGVLNFILTVLDINFHYEETNLLYVLNSIYFIMYEVIFVLIFMYGINYLKKWKTFKKHKVLFLSPIILVSILILLSPWTKWIYYICSDIGFRRGTYFEIIGMLPFLYLSIYIYFNKGYSIKPMDKAEKRKKRTSNIAIAIAFIGIVANYYFKTILLMEFFLSLSLMIMYISMENPEFYYWETTNMYNLRGFLSLAGEYMMEKKKFYCYGIKITNFYSLKSYHGVYNLFNAMEELGKWMDEHIDDGYVFYTKNQSFVVVSEKKADLENALKMMNERLKTPFKAKDAEVFFKGQLFSFEDPYIFNDAKDILTALNSSMEERFLSNDKVFYIGDKVCQKIKRKTQVTQIVHEKIMNKDVEIYLQPVYNGKTKKIEGAEALVRIIDENLGMLSPVEFIPITEANGEIIDLGLVVFEKACEYVKTHDLQEMGLEFINVNLSPIQLLDPYLIEDLKTRADSYGVDISRFHFEITETDIDESSLVDLQVDKLKKTGASIILDDFGKGTSNLERLLKYPFTVAKLDMMLVWNYFDGKNKIIKDVINIFKGENLMIVAEGVEEEYMVEKLFELGCDYLQGYHFSKPLPIDEFDKYIKEFNGK